MSVDLKTAIEQKGICLAEVARAVGVNRSSVTRWSKGRVPAERVRAIEAATGIPAHDLRPDIFPSPERTTPTEAKP